MLPMQGVEVNPVRELRSQMMHSAAKKKKGGVIIIYIFIYTIYIYIYTIYITDYIYSRMLQHVVPAK